MSEITARPDRALAVGRPLRIDGTRAVALRKSGAPVTAPLATIAARGTGLCATPPALIKLSDDSGSRIGSGPHAVGIRPDDLRAAMGRLT
jgi:hypothetical protein